MQEEDRIRYCLDGCLELVDETEVLKDFSKTFSIDCLFGCQAMIYNNEFRRSLWSNSNWVDAVVKNIAHIRNKKQLDSNDRRHDDDGQNDEKMDIN